MSKFAIGKDWRTLDGSQRERYFNSYKQFMLYIYAPKFNLYKNQVITVTGIQDINDNQYFISTLLSNNLNNSKAKIKFRYKDYGGGNIKIRDLFTEDISMMLAQRDDNEVILKIVGYNLEKAGYVVLTESDGEKVIGVAKREQPDLIILDWMLPNRVGVDICNFLRQEPTTANIPIIMISAKG